MKINDGLTTEEHEVLANYHMHQVENFTPRESRMPKTKFSKSELSAFHRRLIFEKAFPIKAVKVIENVLESTYNHKLINIDFWSENRKIYRFSVVTKTTPKCYKLQKQLEEYFI